MTETVETVPSRDGVKFDAVTAMLADQVEKGIAEIVAANEILLSSENSETGVRAITTLFKEGKVEDEASVKAWEKAVKAIETAANLKSAALNLYRVNVIGEEAQDDTGDVDKDAVKEQRKTVMASLALMKNFALGNQLSDVISWADSVSVPQVGRNGASSVGGTKKPRAYVSFNGTTHDSFGEAAKAFSSIDGNATITSQDLVQAWSDNGEADSFKFAETEFTVVAKVKAAE